MGKLAVHYFILIHEDLLAKTFISYMENRGMKISFSCTKFSCHDVSYMEPLKRSNLKMFTDVEIAHAEYAELQNYSASVYHLSHI